MKELKEKVKNNLNECTLQEVEDAILGVFVETQCEPTNYESPTEYDGSMMDNEYRQCVLYSTIERKIGIERDLARPFLIRLRNGGNIYMTTTINSDYMPSGSGYFLTENGAKRASIMYNLRSKKV